MVSSAPSGIQPEEGSCNVCAYGFFFFFLVHGTSLGIRSKFGLTCSATSVNKRELVLVWMRTPGRGDFGGLVGVVGRILFLPHFSGITSESGGRRT